MILTASPSSRDSSIVQAELALAQSLGLPIVPVWASGEAWIQSVPLAAAQTQYIDMRGITYDQCFEQLTPRLKELMASRKPRHLMITHSEWDNYAEHSLRHHGMPGYITIQMDEEPSGAVLFDPDAYSSIQAMLDEFYFKYLRDTVPVKTYGSHWLLEDGDRGWCPKRLIVPWEWLRSNEPVWKYEPSWACVPLHNYSLIAESVWRFRKTNKIDGSKFGIRSTAFGIAANSDDLVKSVMTGSEKNLYFLLSSEKLERVPLTAIEPHNYKHLIVLTGDFSHGSYAGHALKETNRHYKKVRF
jgi:hypothetical protein